MILQALYKLAEVEELMLDPDYEPKPVAWIVTVGDNGEYLGITGTHYELPAEGKKKPKIVLKRFNLPREKAVTSGDRAFLLFGKAEYVFGVDPANERPVEKLADRFQLFRNRVVECLEATNDEGVRAVHRFLENEEAVKQATERREEWASNDLFTFIYAPDVDRLVVEREKVRAYWKRLRNPSQPSQGRQRMCIVTGRQFAGEVENVPKIKIIKSWIPPLSFNKPAFESQGWKGNENAPISREAAEAVSTALNRLLDVSYRHPQDTNRTMPRRNLRLSADTVVCYWSPAPDTVPVFGLMEADPEQVPALYHSLWKGVPRELDDPTAFYALTLTEELGRPIVRDWFESTVETVVKNLAAHFEDIATVRNCPPAKGKSHPPSFPVAALTESIADPKERRSEGVPAHLAAQFVKAALTGQPYPYALLLRAVGRYRAEIGDASDDWMVKHYNDARAALIKGVLNRRKWNDPAWQEVKKEMDPNNTNPGYLLGRLMAIVEHMQRAALGPQVKSTVVDSYFSSASSTPQLVFPLLMRRFEHHVSAARRGDDERAKRAGGWLKGQVGEILEHLTSFPPFLSREEQGLFILGYHHQRKWLFTKKELRDAVPVEQEEQ